MNRFIIIARFIVIMISSNLMAFSGEYRPEPVQLIDLKSLPVEAPALKSGGNILFFEDFGNGLPVGWGNYNLNGFCEFAHTFSGPRGPLSLGVPALRSTSSHNGFMILDSDLCASVRPGQTTDAFIATPAINISGQTKLMLRFQHNFRLCCDTEASRLVVEASNDSINWVVFNVRNRVPINHLSLNPVFQNIDLSGLAGGAEKLYLRFRKSGASHYWWMIDDIIVESFSENDLQISRAEFNNGYTIIPDGQQLPFTPAARIRNAGSLEQTTAVLSVIINRQLYINQSDIVLSVPAGHEINLPVMPTFLPPGRGLYNIKFSVDQAEPDQVPSNNIHEATFRITDTIYSRSQNFYNPDIKKTLGTQGASSAGNLFRITGSVDATSVSFVVHESSVIGIPVRVQVFRLNSGNFTRVAESGDYVLSSNDLSNSGLLRWVSIPFPAPVNLTSGDYVAVITSVANGVAIAGHNNSGINQNISFALENGIWSATNIVPMVNLNLGNNVGRCNTIYQIITAKSECGRSTGSIEIIPVTGIAPYTYTWEGFPVITSNSLSNLPAGQYTVRVKDGYGCEITHQITIGSKDLILSYISLPALCGANGSVTVDVINGTGPFRFIWSHDATLNDSVATGLVGGLYNVEVTDINNCRGAITATVESRNELPVKIHTTPSFCNSPTGSIVVTPLAGVAPFTFRWDGYPGVTTGTLTGLRSGIYHFTVTDAGNCSFNSSVTLGDSIYTFDINPTVTNATCGLHNGSVTLAIQGGQSPYSFLWSNGITTPQASNLPPGNYTVTVTDNFGCTAIRSFSVSTSGTMPSVSWQTVNSTGCGQSLGSFTITPQNPNANYVYTLVTNSPISYHQGNFTKYGAIFNKSGSVFSQHNLKAGVYTVRVVNTDGCTRYITLDISDEGGPLITATQQQVRNISCFGRSDGSITVSVQNGGTNPVLLWNDPGNSTTPSISNLAAGTYTLTVNNTEGCRSVASFHISEPAPLLANPIITSPACAGQSTGSIQLAVTGGTLPMSFFWNTGATTRNISNIPAGVYRVSITDINYCTFVNTITVVEPQKLTVTPEITHVLPGQSNGAIRLHVSGGTGNYNFAWNTGQSTPFIDGLTPGMYSVTVSDANNCLANETFYLGTVSTPYIVNRNQFTLFPNPVTHELNVLFPDTHKGNYNYEIFDMSGVRIYTGRGLNTLNNGYILKWNTHGLPNGIYFIRIYNESFSQLLRFLIN